jgi:hypothetical protein
MMSAALLVSQLTATEMQVRGHTCKTEHPAGWKDPSLSHRNQGRGLYARLHPSRIQGAS